MYLEIPVCSAAIFSCEQVGTMVHVMTMAQKNIGGADDEFLRSRRTEHRIRAENLAFDIVRNL